MRNSSFLKIEDSSNLVKDPTSKAILDVDTEALKAYRMKRLQEEKIQSALKDLDELKAQFGEIKNLLGELIFLAKTKDTK
jgi:hypothetical protein